MKLFGWFTGNSTRDDSAREQWKRAWAAAIDGTDENDAELHGQLQALATREPDVEIELEMLEALEQLRTLQKTIASGSLPIIETGHRVVGTEGCHFTAPASLASDQVQASGRVLFTKDRALFVGGGRTSTTPWHAVHQIARIERDLLLIRADRSAAAHFRFNTYADAAVSAFLARQLTSPRDASL